MRPLRSVMACGAAALEMASCGGAISQQLSTDSGAATEASAGIGHDGGRAEISTRVEAGVQDAGAADTGPACHWPTPTVPASQNGFASAYADRYILQCGTTDVNAVSCLSSNPTTCNDGFTCDPQTQDCNPCVSQCAADEYGFAACGATWSEWPFDASMPSTVPPIPAGCHMPNAYGTAPGPDSFVNDGAAYNQTCMTWYCCPCE